MHIWEGNIKSIAVEYLSLFGCSYDYMGPMTILYLLLMHRFLNSPRTLQMYDVMFHQ